jgi:hypothetical protein
MRRRLPDLAPFGHAVAIRGGPLSGVKRTSQLRPPTSEFDPHRASERSAAEPGSSDDKTPPPS